MSFESLLKKRVTVKRATGETVTASGEVTKAFTDLASNVPCDIQLQKGGLVRYEFGEVIEALYDGFFTLSADVQTGDKIVEGTTEYEVLFAEPVHGHHREATLSRGLRKK